MRRAFRKEYQREEINNDTHDDDNGIITRQEIIPVEFAYTFQTRQKMEQIVHINTGMGVFIIRCSQKQWGFTWGYSATGGDSSSVKGIDEGVTKILPLYKGFLAIKEDGSVVTWGGLDSSSIEQSLTSFASYASTHKAAAVIKEDGSVITWGDEYAGGDSAEVSDKLRSGITEIKSTFRAFAALKSDGSIVTWGDSDYYGRYGGDSSSVSAQISNNVSKFIRLTLHLQSLRQMDQLSPGETLHTVEIAVAYLIQ